MITCRCPCECDCTAFQGTDWCAQCLLGNHEHAPRAAADAVREATIQIRELARRVAARGGDATAASPRSNRITVRIVHADEGHVKLRIWMNGALTGVLLMTPVELHKFDDVLLRGYGVTYVLENAAAFEKFLLRGRAS